MIFLFEKYLDEFLHERRSFNATTSIYLMFFILSIKKIDDKNAEFYDHLEKINLKIVEHHQ